MTKSYDCIVIGGGAIGLATAYELSKRSVSVAVVDVSLAKHQASWAAAGIIPPADLNRAHDSWQRLVARGHQLHPIWSDELRELTRIDTEYMRCGGVHLARTPAEAAALRAAANQWSADGIEISDVAATRLSELCCGLETPSENNDFYAVWTPTEAVIHPPRYVQALRKACEIAGVQFVNARVDEWQFDTESVSSVQAGDVRLVGGQFCLATGAWTGLNFEQLGLRIEMKPWRGQVVLLKSDQSASKHRLAVVVNEGPNYLVPRQDGSLLVGSTVEDVGFDSTNTEKGVESLVEFARSLLPNSQLAIEQTWAGLRPGTGDGLPYLGRVGRWHNLFVAAGHFRSGISQSPATAELMTSMMLGESTDLYDLHSFRIDRESN